MMGFQRIRSFYIAAMRSKVADNEFIDGIESFEIFWENSQIALRH